MDDRKVKLIQGEGERNEGIVKVKGDEGRKKLSYEGKESERDAKREEREKLRQPKVKGKEGEGERRKNWQIIDK